jgi:hypothetical protein
MSPDEFDPAKTKLFLMVMNDLINDPNPHNRIRFARQLVIGMGRFLVAPTEVVEQLCHRLEKDTEDLERIADAKVTWKAKHHVTLLRIFLKYRQPILDDIKRETGLEFGGVWPL